MAAPKPDPPPASNKKNMREHYSDIYVWKGGLRGKLNQELWRLCHGDESPERTFSLRGDLIEEFQSRMLQFMLLSEHQTSPL
jgi:hypothetical protein